jgi:hypothetical protein
MTRTAITRTTRTIGSRNEIVDVQTARRPVRAAVRRSPSVVSECPPSAADADAGLAPVTVYVQLRPRAGAAARCLAVLAELAEQHDRVSFELVGLSRDDRVVRFTLGVDLGPREEIAKFGRAAQAAYAFVNAVFVSLYDHMPVYTGEPSPTERSAAAAVLTAGDVAARADLSAAVASIPAPRRGVPVHAAADSVRRGPRSAVGNSAAEQTSLRRSAAENSAVA